uniref:DUF4760 domain-containing protein n=1 Tax=Steinernema glaseri TaxID=37863 RepID=A0A1I8ALS7_9BILA
MAQNTCSFGLLLTITVAISGALLAYSLLRYNTSKPSDTDAYLDKAYLFHERQLSQFNYELREWIRGKEPTAGRNVYYRTAPVYPISRDRFSETLGKLLKTAKASQRKLSQSGDKEYHSKMALNQVYLARAKNEYRVVYTAIERYLKSLAMDRALRLQKFLVDFIGYPENDAVARVNGFLVPFETKIAQLKKIVPLEHHEHIDSYWTDLKRNTTPGILNSCLPKNVGAEEIVKEYAKMTELRVAKCVPLGEDVENGEWLLLFYCILVAFFAWLFILLPILIACR